MCGDFVTLFSAMLTPVVAIVTTYIAWQQWRTNHLQFKLAVYNRRVDVYLALMRFLAAIFLECKVTDEQAETYLVKTREAYFVFSKPAVSEYLQTVYKKWLELRSLARLPGSERAAREDEILKWFHDQLEAAPLVFADDMKLR